MDERFYLQKAQEAEATANAAIREIHRRQWEEIAKEYRILVEVAADLRKRTREIRSDLRSA